MKGVSSPEHFHSSPFKPKKIVQPIRRMTAAIAIRRIVFHFTRRFYACDAQPSADLLMIEPFGTASHVKNYASRFIHHLSFAKLRPMARVNNVHPKTLQRVKGHFIR